MNRVMIVDDDEGVLKSLRRLLLNVPCTYGKLHYQLEVEIFFSPQSALARAREQSFDLFLSDYRMPVMNGVEFLRQVREIQPDAARLIISGYSDLNAVLDAVNDADTFRFLSKPWNDFILVSAIAEALCHRDLMLENRHLAEKLDAERVSVPASTSPATPAPKVVWGADGSALINDKALDAKN